jgi:pyridoxamine 5'-phosphate oxidase-like protein
MTAWKDVEQAEPEFAARVRRLFDSGRHKTIATSRADGSPRISGIECEFADGELRFGSMPGARKGADLRRDPRFALHGPASHPQEGQEAGWPGEAKIAGRAVPAGPVGDGPGGDLFLADISEVVVTRLNPEATLLVIESWTPHRGLRVVERE